MPNQDDSRVSKISTWIYCICILMFKSVVSEAYRYTCNQLCELRCSWLLDTSVRDVIRSFGCQRRRRGCRSGKRARDRRVSIIVNNNITLRSADRSSQLIPVVTTLRRTSVTEPLQFNSTVDIVNIVQQYVVSCIAMHTAVICRRPQPRLSVYSTCAPSAASQQSSTITSSPIACICARWSRRGTTLSTVRN